MQRPFVQAKKICLHFHFISEILSFILVLNQKLGKIAIQGIWNTLKNICAYI